MYLYVDYSIIYIGHDMKTAMYLFSPADFPPSCGQSREPRTRAWAQPRGVKAGDGEGPPGEGGRAGTGLSLQGPTVLEKNLPQP